MMFNRLAASTRTTVQVAIDVAWEIGSPTVEAEHLLLAATRGRDPVARVLHDAGLDDAGLRRALAAETERSLAAVGVSGEAPWFHPFPGRPGFGTSAKLALQRGAASSADRGLEVRHVVLGVLRANVGTVPRALECAGVDRAALTARVEAVA